MNPPKPPSPRRRRSPARPPAEPALQSAGGLPAGPLAAPAAAEDLEEEILLLRTMIRRAVKGAGADPDPQALVRQLDVLSKAMVRLAGLLKAQQALGNNVSMEAALSQALTETIEEIRSRKPQYARS